MSDGGPDSPETPRTSTKLAEVLGRAVKVLRAVRDLSRRELAEASGLSYSYLAEIENGGKQPSSRALAAIAEGLGLSPSELMREAEELEASEVERVAKGQPAPGGARERQMRWFRSRAGRESTLPLETKLSMAASRLISDSADDPPWELDQQLRELMRIVRGLSREDRERVLDLARRLAG